MYGLLDGGDTHAVRNIVLRDTLFAMFVSLWGEAHHGYAKVVEFGSGERSDSGWRCQRLSRADKQASIALLLTPL